MFRFTLAVLASAVGSLAAADTPPKTPAFDLTYLPGVGASGFVAFRPAALADLIPATSDEAKQLMGYALGLLGAQPNAADLPTAAELEQAVLKLSVHTTYDKFAPVGARPHAFGLTSTGGTLRAVKPLDWAARFAKWFPNGDEAEHAGRTYYRMPMTFGEIEVTMAAFAPDDRTVSLDTEENIKELLAALKAKKPMVTPPAGWDAVSRDLIAAAVDLKAKTAFAGMRASHEAKLFRPFLRFEDAVESVVVGVSAGATTRVRATLTARKGGAAAAKALAGLLTRAASGTSDALKEEPDAATPLLKWARAATSEAKVETKGKAVSVTLTAPGDVRTMLERLLAPAD